jgi:hypothetical protein
MRRTTIAAAGAVAALTIGSGIAAASTPQEQTVTITVQAAPLSVTVTGDVTFTVTAGQQGVDLFDGSSSISFANPTANEAEITVASSVNNVSPFDISVTVNSGDGYSRVTGGALWMPTSNTLSRDLVTTVDVGTDVTNVPLQWALSGNAPSEVGDISATFTYTIAEKSGS